MFDRGFHLLGFYTAALPDPSTNAALGTVTDPVITVQNSRYILPADMYATRAYVGAIGAIDARLNMPSLVLPAYPYLFPLSTTVLPGNVPPVVDLKGLGVLLPRTEALALEVSETGGGATAAFAGLWLSPQPRVPVSGRIQTIKATATITGVTGQWVSGNMTLQSNLPEGEYEIVGMEAVGTGLLFARLVFYSQTLRPGVLAQQAVGEWNDFSLRNGNFGTFGRFTNTTVPLLEIMQSAANTAQTVYLDIIKRS